jgi:hypothetical protein
MKLTNKRQCARAKQISCLKIIESPMQMHLIIAKFVAGAIFTGACQKKPSISPAIKRTAKKYEAGYID